MIIRIDENRFNKLFLFESKNSKRADKQTANLIGQRMGIDPNSKMAIELQKAFRQMYFGDEGLNDDWFIVLEPNFCAAAIDLGFLDDAYTINNTIKELLKYAHRKAKGLIETKGREEMLTYISELKGNITGWDTLYELVGKAYKIEREESRNKADQVEQGESQYKVVGPLDFQEANDYGAYTSTGGEICYTMNGRTWNQYTHRDDYAVYLLLKDGWDTVPEEHDGDEEDPDSAYDTYGMSMIFVIVDENGNLKTCNTRWNHDGDYDSNHDVDFALDEYELSELVGKPFKEVFKPKMPLGMEDKIKKAATALKESYLTEREELENFFDEVVEQNYGAFAVRIMRKWNYVISNVFECKLEFIKGTELTWFDDVGQWCEPGFKDVGVGPVLIEGKGWNYIKNDGTYLLDGWVEEARSFGCSGYGFVKPIGGEYSIIDINGNVIPDKETIFKIAENAGEDWPSHVDEFRTDYMFSNLYRVTLMGLQNYVYKDRFLSPGLWFATYDLEFSGNKLCRVIHPEGIDYGFNFLKLEGGLLFDHWLEQANDFKQTGPGGVFYAEVVDGGRSFLIDSNGNEIDPKKLFNWTL